MNRSPKEIMEATAGGLAAATALAAAIGELTKSLDGLHQQFHNPATVWLLWVAVAAGLFFGLSWLARGLSRKSRLRHPDALELDPDNPDHLRGRNPDIVRLSDDLRNHPLQFLEGESGSGKSSLIRSGLIPALNAQLTRNVPLGLPLLPIYVNAYPGDWQDGLVGQLTAAAWRALGEARRGQLGIQTLDDLRRILLPAPIGEAEVDASLPRRLRNEQGLTMLLIFDQFDDYQLAHRSRFLRDGRWIVPDQLCAENALWRAVADELTADHLHALFVTRQELFAGLDAVRFVPAKTYSLDRVEPAYITALLEQLVGGGDDADPVISNPAAGWEALKERVITDLTVQGRVLPIQARIVFKGLIDLPYLSIATYERAGGIDGLEAGYIEDAVATASRTAGLSTADVLKLLLRLVDETKPDLPKARAAGEAALSGSASLTEAQVPRLLDILRQQGVIRPQLGATGQPPPDTTADAPPNPAWTLYHDYLARPILTAQRRANRWQRLLVERLRAYRAATDWRGRWRALLSPLEQLRLLWPTVRGRLRWSGYRGLALRSTLRLAPLLVAAGIASVGTDLYLDQRAEARAERILSAIRGGIDDELPEAEEYRQLWHLASGNHRLKLAFMDRALSDPHAQAALAKHTPRVAHALLGLDAGHRLRARAMARGGR